LVQKKKSDIIINFYEDHTNIIQCNLIINNKIFSNKILKDMIELKYDVQFLNDELVIALKNSIYIENNVINNIFEENESIFKSNYYKEIFYCIYLIIFKCVNQHPVKSD
jgi:hypothetical protein